ncbi:uncharacterized protein METZ01_LOCUS180138, partial [marine metagenome]
MAEHHEGVEAVGMGVEMVARLIDENDDFRRFLETPRIAVEQKKEVIRSAFGETLPVKLVNFLQVTLDKRRQRLLRAIAREYMGLMDQHFNRVHVEVTLARKLDEISMDE